MLRSEKVFKLLRGRSLEDDDLASPPTLSRFENTIDGSSLRRLEEVNSPASGLIDASGYDWGVDGWGEGG